MNCEGMYLLGKEILVLQKKLSLYAYAPAWPESFFLPSVPLQFGRK